MPIRWFLPVLAALFTALAAVASADDSDAAARLAAELEDYASFQADFVQVVEDERGSTLQETEGNLKAKRPGLFYWKTEAPGTQFITSNGKEAKVYDPDLEQVTIHPLDQQVASTPAMLLSGQVSDLAQAYEVSLRTSGDDTREYTLVPKDSDSLFTALTLRFSRGQLQEMRMDDSLGQRTVLYFENVRVNAEVADAEFELDYPDSVDVIQGAS